MTFSHLSSYKRHILLEHAKTQVNDDSDLEANNLHVHDDGQQLNPAEHDEELDEVMNWQHESDSDDDSQKSKSDVLEGASVFIGHMKASSMPYSTVQQVVNEAEELVQTVVNHLQKKVASVVNEVKNSSKLKEVDTAKLDVLLRDFEYVKKPFDGLRTPSQQDSFFKAKGILINPEEICVGRSFVSQSDTSTGGVRQKLQRDTFQYVPLAKTIKKHLEQPGVMSSILEQQPSKNECLLKTYRDGNYFQAKFTQGNDLVIPVLLYSDDYETGNPLGSRKGTNKLTAFYVSLICLPTKFQSSLSNILLAACAKRTVVAEYGIDSVLSVMVQDFKVMEREGIHVSCSSYTGIVKPVLFQVIGDNLGLHELLGFAGSFSANYSCRYCKVSKVVLHNQLEEDTSLLRNIDNFNEDLAINDISKTGIKRSSELNKLDDFHVCDNYAPDVMHDFLEGILPLEFKLVMAVLIEEGCFSLQELNERIASFNYGFAEKKNKPSPIQSSHLTNPSGSSGQKAVQMKCLACYIPLIVGDLIDDLSDVWELFLLLLDIYKIVMAPCISRAGTYVLKALIRDHHRLFLSLFQDRHLTPKHHFLVHYPRLIQLLGPLVQYSSMRKEGKHKPFKRWASACNNYKNIEKTVTERHQRQQSYIFLMRKPLNCDMEIKNQLPVLVSSLDEAEEVCSVLGCTLDDTVTMSGSVCIQSYEFKPNCMVISEWDDEGPQFAQLKHIMIVGSNLYFLANLWEISFYNRHRHAYAVTESNGHIIIKQPQDLFLSRPLHITKCHSKTDLFWYIMTPINIV